ncbi:acetyltransferase (GNAT) family protein [Kribbella kalugense]|uniref:Acetyltransferase (GNAT) family protein n=1 Tax=Kribbella kalugense TaxID=2512221 RepID=A0A4V3G765_9ACTN|nr:acetyltransferase (GNAT) family protein [Kribbella kalugense]
MVLRPITDAEYPDWKDLTATSFAAGIGPVRGLNADEAVKFAYEETERLLPDGPATEHHLIWIAEAGDEPVGSLWISLRSKIPFIFGIEVDSTQRGKGYGRAIMLAGQDECRRLGHTQIDLNVFADNTTAVGLYDSLGYAVISQQMRLDL